VRPRIEHVPFWDMLIRQKWLNYNFNTNNGIHKFRLALSVISINWIWEGGSVPYLVEMCADLVTSWFLFAADTFCLAFAKHPASGFPEIPHNTKNFKKRQDKKFQRKSVIWSLPIISALRNLKYSLKIRRNRLEIHFPTGQIVQDRRIVLSLKELLQHYTKKDLKPFQSLTPLINQLKTQRHHQPTSSTILNSVVID